MSRKTLAAIVFAWILSLVGVAVWAQERKPAPGIELKSGDPIGDVITGENIGFQRVMSIEPDRQGKISGQWMVKVNGRWMPTQAPVVIVR